MARLYIHVPNSILLSLVERTGRWILIGSQLDEITVSSKSNNERECVYVYAKKGGVNEKCYGTYLAPFFKSL